MAAPRLLMLATPSPSGVVGGQGLVVEELAEQLRARGWLVQTPENWESPQLYSGLSRGQRWASALNAWYRKVPADMRRLFSHATMPRAYYAAAAHNLRAAARQIGEARFDVLMVHVDGAPPGLCTLASGLAAKLKRSLVLVSMAGLAEELRAFGWAASRGMAFATLRGSLPPGMFRPVRPAQIERAIFASDGWRLQAVAAGLPAERGRTIYFGVPLTTPLPRPAAPGRRLLWVGRLSPEKGLHLLLRALPALRRRLPGVTVTAIAAPGSSSYRHLVESLVREAGLDGVFTMRPPVPRAALAEAYASHDALFFHSIFDDPVALVLMEAFAAGIPVASSAAAPDARLVRPEETCATYDVRRADSVVQALQTVLTNGPFRDRVTANARRLVHAEFSLEAMGRRYDAALRECLLEGGRTHPPPLPAG